MGAPRVGARLESGGFGQLPGPLVLEPPGQPGQLDIPLAVDRGGVAEVDPAQLLPAPPTPSAVVPGTHDQIVKVSGVVTLQGLADLERPVEIFLVPPARNVERRDPDPVEVLHHRLALPEGVVV